jgi:HK97 family phage portal protein
MVRRPAVLPASMVFQPLSMNFTDADIAAVRTLNAIDVCHLFGVPSWLVNVSMPGASTTYSNAEQQQAVFKVMTLTRWTSRLERWGSDLLPGRMHAQFDFSEMLRTSTSEQYAAWNSAIETGILTINEVRQLMRRHPVPYGDDPGSVKQQAYVAQTSAYVSTATAQGQTVTPDAQNVA